MSAGTVTDAFANGLERAEPHDAAERIIRQAIALRASDLFILSDEHAAYVALRVTGQVERVAAVSRDQGRHLMNFFKTTAGMDIAERRRPQEGRWIFEFAGDRVDL